MDDPCVRSSRSDRIDCWKEIRQRVGNHSRKHRGWAVDNWSNPVVTHIILGESHEIKINQFLTLSCGKSVWVLLYCTPQLYSAIDINGGWHGKNQICPHVM